MLSGSLFVFIVLLRCCNIILAQKMILDGKYERVEGFYLQQYIKNNKMNTLCRLSASFRLAMCEKFLQNFPVEPASFKRIFFNKAAAFYLTPNCVKHNISVVMSSVYQNIQPEQEIFPCYGRHYVMRTDWQIDDYFDFFYLFDGPVANSIFVARHFRTATSDMYLVQYIISNFVVDLSARLINEEELHEDLKSLESVSVNDEIWQIEKNYVLDVVERKTDIPDLVCALSEADKYLLCKKMLEFSTILKGDFVVDKAAFNELSVDCVNQPLDFIYMTDYNGKEILQKMYPCYGNHKQNNEQVHKAKQYFFVSGGYRKNSIILYDRFIKKDTISPAINIYRFYENVNMKISEEDNHWTTGIRIPQNREENIRALPSPI